MLIDISDMMMDAKTARKEVAIQRGIKNSITAIQDQLESAILGANNTTTYYFFPSSPSDDVEIQVISEILDDKGFDFSIKGNNGSHEITISW